MPDQNAVNMALRLGVKPGEVSGLAIVMYCRPYGATNEEVTAACGQSKTNRAKDMHLQRRLDFMTQVNGPGRVIFVLTIEA
jgi:hypothetical protein